MRDQTVEFGILSKKTTKVLRKNFFKFSFFDDSVFIINQSHNIIIFFIHSTSSFSHFSDKKNIT
jgi:hypothetical protein